MDPAVAKELYHQYGVILCLDAPTDQTLEFGIDTNSWVTGPLFKGIKLIPPGIHYAFYRYVNKPMIYAHPIEIETSESGPPFPCRPLSLNVDH